MVALPIDPGYPAGAEPARRSGRRVRNPGDDTMLDILFLALTVGFFAASVAYVHACDRL